MKIELNNFDMIIFVLVTSFFNNHHKNVLEKEKPRQVE